MKNWAQILDKTKLAWTDFFFKKKKKKEKKKNANWTQIWY